MKEYQILLVENDYSEDSWQDKIICELGSSDSIHSGKALDPVFTTKIDGTHLLTFDMPQYYLDTDTGEYITNELTNFIANKSKIILRRWKDEKRLDSDMEEFHFVVNDREDKREGGKLAYSFSCLDSFIEELARTGYGISFSDDVEATNHGLGTIDQLAEEILKDSSWSYDKDSSDSLLEYSTKLEYKAPQMRYDTTYVSKPSFDIKYIEEPLNRYCYLVDEKHYSPINGEQVYCYEDSNQITSSTAKNILYNADSKNGAFVDTTGWSSSSVTTIDGKVEDAPAFLMMAYRYNEDYSLQLKRKSDREKSFLINNSSTLTDTVLKEGVPYLLSFDFGKSTAGKINSFSITSKNPLQNKELLAASQGRDYHINFPEDMYVEKTVGGEKVKVINENKFIVIKPSVTIRNPYFIFELEIPKQEKSIYIYSVKLIEAVGKKSQDDTVSAESNYLEALSNLTNGKVFNKNDSIKEKIDLSGLDSIAGEGISAYTNRNFQYFYFENDIEKEENLKYVSTSDVFSGKTVKEKYKNETNIPSCDPPEDTSIYIDKYGRHYQYYVTSDEVIKEKGDNWEAGGAWGPALLKEDGQKRRTLTSEKSNRFNLIQELAELFKAWPVFSIIRDKEGKLQKKVFFKENTIRQNFSGFHYGINLEKLSRKQDSETLVTKIIVEDVPSDYAENGFVTIRTARDNPWGENYFYNFKHYVDQRLLSNMGNKYDDEGNVTGTGLQIDIDLENLYKEVKGYNKIILDNNEKLTSLKVDHANTVSQIKSLEYALSGISERVESIKADLENKNISIPDKQKLNNSLNNYNKQREEYENSLARLEKVKESLAADIENLETEVEENQENKTVRIKEFETKYLPFIKEGVWSDSSYVDNNAYYLDAQKVSNTSAVPLTTWSISVLDTSVLKEMEEFEVKVGDQTILVDNEFFAVQPSSTENYTFEVLITSIAEHLEDESKNSIEVKNYFTSFEDLFQRISATVQSVQLKEQSYDMAAESFTNDKQIAQDIIQNTLTGNQLVLANASDNSYKLDHNGLTLQSILNPSKRARVLAEGIFFSNSLDSKGSPQWKTGLTADGINASLITAGQIDTSLIRILSNGQPNFSWSDLGITSYGKETITTEGSNVGNVIFIGDSYTRNYDLLKREKGKYITENSKYVFKDGVTNEDFLHGWPEELCKELKIPSAKFIDLGIGSSGFAPRSIWRDPTDKDKEKRKTSPFLYKNQLRNLTSKFNILPFVDSKEKNDKTSNQLSYSDGRWNYWFDYENPTYDKLQKLTKDWLNNLTHIVIGGGFNEGIYFKDMVGSDLFSKPSELKMEMEKVKLIIGLLQKYRNPDNDPEKSLTIILASIGQSNSSVLVNKMLDDIYELYEKYWTTDYITGDYSKGDLFDEKLIAQAKEGLTTCVFDFMDVSKNWSGSSNYAVDDVHPNSTGISKIASELKNNDTLKKREVICSGNIFTRLDSYGLYIVKEKTEDNFNYTVAADLFQPWFTGLSREQCLRQIQKNSLVSFTEKGFSLNVPNSKGSIKLGYEDIESNNNYGLYIKDKDGNLIVQLHNDPDSNKISGWNITSDSFLNEKIIDNKEKRIFYLSNGAESDDDTAMAIGKIGQGDSEESASFRVTADGQLYATGARFSGNGSFAGSISARSGKIGAFSIETKGTDWWKDVDDILFIGDSYAISGDDYDGTAQRGWPEALMDLLNSVNYSKKRKYYKNAVGQTGFSTGSNVRNIQTYIPEGEEGQLLFSYDSTGNSDHYYYMRTSIGWERIENFTKNFLDKQNKNNCYYNAQLGYFFYYNDEENKWAYWDVAEKNSLLTTDFMKGKKIITISSNLNTKPVIPWYSYTNKTNETTFYRRGSKGEYNIYDDGIEDFLNRSHANKNNIYALQGTGAFYIYDNNNDIWISSTWNVFNTNTALYEAFFNRRGKIETIQALSFDPSDLSSDDSIKNSLSLEPIIMYYDELIKNKKTYKGYWYQDPGDKYEWKFCTSATAILNLIGNPQVNYILPNEVGYFFYNSGWKYASGRVSGGFGVQLKNNPDNAWDRSFNNTYFYGFPTNRYGYVSYSDEDGITYAKMIDTGYAPKNFFKSENNPYVDKRCLYSTDLGVAFFFDEDAGDWGGASEKNYSKIFSEMRTFTALFEEKINELSATELSNISHIIVGGGFNDRVIQLTGQSTTNVAEGVKTFYNKVREKGINATILVVPIGQSRTSSTANKTLEETYEQYERAIKEINNTNIRLINVSKMWGIDKVNYQDDNVHPSLVGADSIASSIHFSLSKVTGKFYGKTNNTDKITNVEYPYVTSGFSFESIASGSVALWAGYKGAYNTPFEDGKALDDDLDWIKRTPFYVTHGGKLWATEAHIEGDIYANNGRFTGEIYSDKGEIGDCTIADGKLIASEAFLKRIATDSAFIGNLTVNEANINKLSVNKLTTGTCNDWVKFSNIHSTGGTIGGWNINSDSISSSVSGAGEILLQPNFPRIVARQDESNWVTMGLQNKLEPEHPDRVLPTISFYTLSEGSDIDYRRADLYLSPRTTYRVTEEGENFVAEEHPSLRLRFRRPIFSSPNTISGYKEYTYLIETTLEKEE